MTTTSDPRWREQAQCAETDPEAFFPPVGAVPHAAPRDIAYGVLGGLTANQRRKLLRAHDANTRRTRRAA